MAAEQNRCAETQRFLGCTSLKLAFRQTGAQHLASDISHWRFPPNCSPQVQKRHFLSFSSCCSPQEARLPLYYFVQVCVARTATSLPRPAGAWPASRARSTAAHAWPPNPSPSLNGIFLTFMWIWWAHCSTVTVLIIFLPSSISHPNGRKLFHFLRRLWWHALKLSHSLGFHVLGCPKQSLLIVGHNLLLIFGFNFARCLTSHIGKQLLIILSRTE
jgi:hypothetical protein